MEVRFVASLYWVLEIGVECGMEESPKMGCIEGLDNIGATVSDSRCYHLDRMA